MTRSLVVAALISGVFVVAGVLLSWMRSWNPTRDRWSDPAGSTWPTALAGSLVVIAGLTVVASAGLLGLWRQIVAQLSAIDFWNGLTTPSQFGGIVTLPIVLALFVPGLVTVAALFSFVVPFVLLARLPSRPLMFPTMMSRGAVCQSALVASGWLATRLMRELSQVAATSMTKAPDADVRQLADQLATVGGCPLPQEASSRLRDIHARCWRIARCGSTGDPRHLRRRIGLSLDAVARLRTRRARRGRHLARCPRDQPARGERRRSPDARSHSSAAWQGPVSDSRVAYPQSGGIAQHGSFTFGVGVPVPPDGSGVTYSLSERGSSDRGRRFTLLSGLLLLGIGAVISYRVSLAQASENQ